MKYSIDWLIGKQKSGERIKYMFFWGHQPSRDGTLTVSCFSQWWPSAFIVDDVTYRSAEHYMMSEKARLFGDEESRKKIIACNKPAEANALGREIVGFNDEMWLKHRYEIVLKGSIQKFSQDADLKNFLINTGDRVLVEASPVDAIWGIGIAADHKNAEHPELWRGLNLLGFALMEARDVIMDSERK